MLQEPIKMDEIELIAGIGMPGVLLLIFWGLIRLERKADKIVELLYHINGFKKEVKK